MLSTRLSGNRGLSPIPVKFRSNAERRPQGGPHQLQILIGDQFPVGVLQGEKH